MRPLFRTFVLMVALGALLMFVGSFWGSTGVWIGFGTALVANLAAWWNSANSALKAMNARPVTEQELPQVYAMVRELSTRAGKPMPSIHLAPTRQPNAFATGRSPKHAAVCVTTGILERLDGRQLRAVLGHELGHVYNWDILINSIAAAFASAIMFLANLSQFGMVFGTPADEDEQTSRTTLALIAVFGPVAATVIRMAVGRTRELGADRSAGILSDDPLALASALQAIEKGVLSTPLTPTSKALARQHMMLFNPFSLLGFAGRLFSTHPPTATRVAKMQKLAETVDPEGDGPDYQLPAAMLAGLPLSAARARQLDGPQRMPRFRARGQSARRQTQGPRTSRPTRSPRPAGRQPAKRRGRL